MSLNNDDQWMLNYLQGRVKGWSDVRDGAARAMKRIKAHDDFVDWSDYFLPQARREELKRALTAHKIAQAKSKKSPVQNADDQLTMKLSEPAVKLLLAHAKQKQMTPSELIIKLLS